MSGRESTDPTVETEHTEQRRAPSSPLGRGQLVGRYVVIATAGQGAMGAVYVAYDPDLDRRVAIKVLHSDATHGGSQRLVREARAIARLSHPNVVAVHDVGVVGGRVFIAMEFIEGTDLRQWLREAKRSPSEIVSVFRGAGEGLAAAHEAGLVHRDFKPANVMIAVDGRPRVVDFGLVQAAEVDSEVGSGSSGRASDLTASGAVLGTPAYMAPEQFERGDVGPAADQFAFCVALYEALYGERPFAADSLEELRVAVVSGRMQPLPSRTGVPANIAETLARGLATDPDQRHPSMRALLKALARSTRSRLRWAAGASAIGLLAAAGVVGLVRDDEAPCTRGEERVADAWGDPVRARVAQELNASQLAYARTAADVTVTGLDDYAREWSAMYRNACEATHVWGTQSTELLDRRMACLDDARRQLAAVARVLAESESGGVDRAPDMVASLPFISTCADADALLAVTPEPTDPELRARLDAARETYARARALVLAGRYADATELADQLLPEADAIDYAPLVAEAHLLKGQLLERTGTNNAAETEVNLALGAALRSGQDRLATTALGQLLWIVGGTPARAAETDRLFAMATATIDRIGGDDDLTAYVSLHYAESLDARGQYREALVAARRGLELRMKQGDETRIGTALSFEGSLLRQLGEHDDAVVSLGRAQEILAGRLGPDHPRALAVTNNLARAHFELGDIERALPLFESALAGLERNLGPSHPSVAAATLNLGSALFHAGFPDRARARLDQAVRLYGDDPEGAEAFAALAVLERDAGRLDEALELVTRAHDLVSEHRGSEHPYVSMLLSERAVVYRMQGRYDDARREHERAVALAERTLEPSHPALDAIRKATSETLAAAADVASNR